MSKSARNHRNKKYVILLVTVIVYLAWVFIRPLPRPQPINDLPAVTATTPSPTLAWSRYGEQAVGVQGYGVLATHGAQTVLPMASIAKVMVALAVLQRKPLDLNQQGPAVPITDTDVSIYQQDLAANQSVVPVQTGEQISEYESLQALLIPSANNMATTLSSWAFGSETAYLTFANEYAEQLGMTDTTFQDSSGFLPSTVSTPSDLIVLGEAAMKQPVIAQIVNQYTATLPVAGQVHNVNVDINPANPRGINGIKTGNTDQAGGCFLFSTLFQNTTAIGVVMNAPDLGTALYDAPALATSLRTNLQLDTVIHAGQKVAHYVTAWGQRVDAAAQQDGTVIDWVGSHIPVTTALNPIPATAHNHRIVGTVRFQFNKTSHTVDVQLSHDIPQPSLWWRITHP